MVIPFFKRNNEADVLSGSQRNIKTVEEMFGECGNLSYVAILKQNNETKNDEQSGNSLKTSENCPTLNGVISDVGSGEDEVIEFTSNDVGQENKLPATDGICSDSNEVPAAGASSAMPEVSNVLETSHSHNNESFENPKQLHERAFQYCVVAQYCAEEKARHVKDGMSTKKEEPQININDDDGADLTYEEENEVSAEMNTKDSKEAIDPAHTCQESIVEVECPRCAEYLEVVQNQLASLKSRDAYSTIFGADSGEVYYVKVFDGHTYVVVTSPEYPPYLAAEVVDVVSNGILMMEHPKQMTESDQQPSPQPPQGWNQKIQSWFGNPNPKNRPIDETEKNTENYKTHSIEQDLKAEEIEERKSGVNTQTEKEMVDFEPDNGLVLSPTQSEADGQAIQNDAPGPRREESVVDTSISSDSESACISDSSSRASLHGIDCSTISNEVTRSEKDIGESEGVQIKCPTASATDDKTALSNVTRGNSDTVPQSTWIENLNVQRKQLLARFEKAPNKQQNEQHDDHLTSGDVKQYTKVVFLQYGSFEEGTRANHCLLNTIELKQQMNPQINFLMGYNNAEEANHSHHTVEGDRKIQTVLTQEQIDVIMRKLVTWSRTFKRRTKSVRNRKAELITGFGTAAAVGSIVVFAIGGLIFAGPELALLTALGGEVIETSVLAAACGIAYKITSHAAEKTWFWSQPFVPVESNAPRPTVKSS